MTRQEIIDALQKAQKKQGYARHMENKVRMLESTSSREISALKNKIMEAITDIYLYDRIEKKAELREARLEMEDVKEMKKVLRTLESNADAAVRAADSAVRGLTAKLNVLDAYQNKWDKRKSDALQKLNDTDDDLIKIDIKKQLAYIEDHLNM